MRAVLLERVQPLVERFAEQLADLLVDDVERRVAQLGEAFDVALSTFAAELAAPDVRDAGSPLPGLAVPETAAVAEQVSTSSNTHGRPGRRAQQTSAPSDDPAEGLAGSAPRAPGRPSTRSTASASGVTAALTTAGKPRQRAVMKCGKCGRIGSRSDGCGTSHEPLAPDAKSTPAIATPSLVTPPPYTLRPFRLHRRARSTARSCQARARATRRVLHSSRWIVARNTKPCRT